MIGDCNPNKKVELAGGNHTMCQMRCVDSGTVNFLNTYK